MILKMYQIIEFPYVFQKVKSFRLPFKTSYRLTLLAQEIEKHNYFYQEEFQKLINIYSEKDENGNPCPTSDGQGVRLMSDTMDEAYTKLGELRNLDVEIPDTTFKSEEFDNTELSPEDIMILMPFIKD